MTIDKTTFYASLSDLKIKSIHEPWLYHFWYSINLPLVEYLTKAVPSVKYLSLCFSISLIMSGLIASLNSRSICDKVLRYNSRGQIWYNRRTIKTGWEWQMLLILTLKEKKEHWKWNDGPFWEIGGWKSLLTASVLDTSFLWFYFVLVHTICGQLNQDKNMPPPKVLTDTSLWLHNKLGTSNDLWSGGSICSQLNPEVLRSIRDCFNLLQSQVKLKLILSFLHIQRRNIDEVSVECIKRIKCIKC